MATFFSNGQKASSPEIRFTLKPDLTERYRVVAAAVNRANSENDQRTNPTAEQPTTIAAYMETQYLRKDQDYENLSRQKFIEQSTEQVNQALTANGPKNYENPSKQKLVEQPSELISEDQNELARQ
jgi:hypothetical protein